MTAYQAGIAKFEGSDTQVFGISEDFTPSQKEFAEKNKLTFPLLSDWGGDVTRKYGVYVDKYKAARRVNFLIGKDGKILETQVDKEAIDPTKIVAACERHKVAR